MNTKTKEVYSEVYQVLNLLGNDYINELPIDLVNMLRNNRKLDYNPIYIDTVSLSEQNIKKETLSIIVLLYLKYWCIDENEKMEIKNILEKNEEKYKEKFKDMHDFDSFLKNKLSSK